MKLTMAWGVKVKRDKDEITDGGFLNRADAEELNRTKYEDKGKVTRVRIMR